MITADRIIAIGLMGLSLYFMWHAMVLPIGWNGMTGGPGGGAFPFWLSGIMFVCAGAILIRSLRADPATQDDTPFFDPEMRGAVASVCIALTACIALMGWLGAYVAIFVFQFWYLRIFGKHGWTLTAAICAGTPVFLFFFFEVTLRILLPKGVTEPLFFPLYARFF